jgi:hypothetical protein
MEPILYLYYEKSLVSSNLNSKLEVVRDQNSISVRVSAECIGIDIGAKIVFQNPNIRNIEFSYVLRQDKFL